MTLVGKPIHKKVQEEDFSYSVTLFERECLPTPKLLLHGSVVPLTVILTILVIMILVVAKVAQLRLLVCERFFPIAAEARVEHLHAKILRNRLKKRPPNVTSPSSKVVCLRSPAVYVLTWWVIYLSLFQLRFLFPLIFRPKKIPGTTV